MSSTIKSLQFTKTFQKSGKINRILLTGASGQIGIAMLPYLNDIYGSENVLCSFLKNPPSQTFSSINKWVSLDVQNLDNIKQIVKDFKPDQIIHMTALLSAYSEKNPHQSYDINIKGFQNMLNVAADNNIKFFNASSIAAFGPNSPQNNAPNECLMQPKTIYGISKIYQELMGSYYKKQFGLDFRSLRYPIVISPFYAINGSAVYVCQIFFEGLKYKKYNCYLKPDTLLPFIYIYDLIEGTLQFIEISKEKLSRDIYNQGGLSFTPQQLIDEIKQKHIPDINIGFNFDDRQKIVDTWPKSIDSSIAQKDWGWSPRFNLEQITNEMMQKVQIAIEGNLQTF